MIQVFSEVCGMTSKCLVSLMANLFIKTRIAFEAQRLSRASFYWVLFSPGVSQLPLSVSLLLLC